MSIKSILKSLERFIKKRVWEITVVFSGNREHDGPRPDAQEIGSLLILRVDGKIGNMVLTLPLIPAFRSLFPAAELRVLTAPNQAPILKHNPFIRELIPFAFRDLIVRPFRSLALFRKLAGADLVIECSNPGSFSLSHAFLLLLTRGRYRLGFDRGESRRFLDFAVPLNQDQHYRDIMLDLARFFRADIEVKGIQVFLSPGEIEEGERFVNEIRNGRNDACVIGIWAGARHRKKWDRENYARLGEALAAVRAVPFFLFGPEEERLRGEYSDTANTIAVTVTDIRKLASIFNACDLIICGDTGPLHLAAALQRPTIGLFNFPNMNIYGYDDGNRFRSVFLPGLDDPVAGIAAIAREILETVKTGEHA